MTYGQKTQKGRLPIKSGDYIGAFDPGGTTGISQLRYDGGINFHVVCAVALPWKDRFMIREYLSGMQWIVVERFTPYGHKAQSLTNDTLPAVQVIGIIEAFAHTMGYLIDDIVYQPAHVAIGTKILDHDMPLVRGSEHKKDAYKHGRTFIILNGFKADS